MSVHARSAHVSIDALLHHPLAVALESAQQQDADAPRWYCRTPVGECAEFAYCRKPAPAHPVPGTEAVTELACRWLRRRGVEIQCSAMGLICPRSRRLWVADIVGERRGRVVLAAAYFSPRRGGRARAEMRQYARLLGDVCRRVYRIRGASTALINVYGDGRAEGELLPDPGDGRADGGLPPPGPAGSPGPAAALAQHPRGRVRR